MSLEHDHFRSVLWNLGKVGPRSRTVHAEFVFVEYSTHAHIGNVCNPDTADVEVGMSGSSEKLVPEWLVELLFLIRSPPSIALKRKDTYFGESHSMNCNDGDSISWDGIG